MTFPAKALEQHLAILGKTGSGKTYAAKGVVEGILSDGGRVCVIDPTGAWHGLRSSATGKSAGFPVVIFGGAHADLPLGGAHGEAIAEIIGTDAAVSPPVAASNPFPACSHMAPDSRSGGQW